MNWSNIRRTLQRQGYTHDEIEQRLDELLDHDRAEDEPPKQEEKQDETR